MYEGQRGEVGEEIGENEGSRSFWFGLVWFNDISTFVGYLMPKPSL